MGAEPVHGELVEIRDPRDFRLPASDEFDPVDKKLTLPLGQKNHHNRFKGATPDMKRGAMAAYCATLWALGFRLKQFARHE